jgi:hypothetical protein
MREYDKNSKAKRNRKKAMSLEEIIEYNRQNPWDRSILEKFFYHLYDRNRSSRMVK